MRGSASGSVVASLNPWAVAGSLLSGLHGNTGQADAYRSAAAGSSRAASSPVILVQTSSSS